MPAQQNLFKGRQYISLETYRKSGEAVRTPVWFAEADGKLYVWTFGQSGKAKRIRNCPAVKVAPSDMRGSPLGEYVSGEAQIYPGGAPTFEHGNRALNKKYGLLKKLFEFLNRKHADQQSIIEIHIFM